MKKKVNGQWSIVHGLWTMVCGLLLFYSCNNKQKNKQQIFYYNESTGLATLDPAFAKNQQVMWTAHQLYNTLVEVDTNLNIVPSLAKSWEVSADRLVYTFHLRDSIFFMMMLFLKKVKAEN